LNARPTYEEFQSLPAINEAFAAKRLDGVFEAEAPCIVGKAAGIDLKIVAVSALVDVPVIVHKDSHIEKLSDLRGKKIAFYQVRLLTMCCSSSWSERIEQE